MNIGKVNFGSLLIGTLQKSVRNYSVNQLNPNQLPYTMELYRKNFIKFKVKSKQGVTHDYVYHGDERLPTYEERLKGKVKLNLN
jgi:hypothetical protein